MIIKSGFAAVLLSFMLPTAAHAAPIRVMSFNVMCSFCGHKEESGHFKERMKGVADTVNRYHPDLISFQELLNRRNLSRITKYLDREYTPVFAKGLLLSYNDPTLLILKSRYKVINHGGFWLGPNSPRFSLGWQIGYPRRVEWAELEEIATGFRFKFYGTHFDNAHKNKEHAATLTVKNLTDETLPVIFAGDTNLEPAMTGYSTLTSLFRDSYNEVTEHPYYGPGNHINSDGCDLSPTSVFPDCRIDHVMMSRNAPWKTKSWGLDVHKYFGTSGFLSDHRALIVDLDDSK